MAGRQGAIKAQQERLKARDAAKAAAASEATTPETTTAETKAPTRRGGRGTRPTATEQAAKVTTPATEASSTATEVAETTATTTVETKAPVETAKTPTHTCLLYTSPSPRDQRGSRMPSSA